MISLGEVIHSFAWDLYIIISPKDDIATIYIISICEFCCCRYVILLIQAISLKCTLPSLPRWSTCGIWTLTSEGGNCRENVRKPVVGGHTCHSSCTCWLAVCNSHPIPHLSWLPAKYFAVYLCLVWNAQWDSTRLIIGPQWYVMKMIQCNLECQRVIQLWNEKRLCTSMIYQIDWPHTRYGKTLQQWNKKVFLVEVSSLNASELGDFSMLVLGASGRHCNFLTLRPPLTSPAASIR